MTTQIETELDRYEFASAVAVWDALSEADKERLLSLPHWKGFKEAGKTFNLADAKFIDEPEFAALIEIGLAVDQSRAREYTIVGHEKAAPLVYYQQGYFATPFGEMVARYGRAKRIVEKAESLKSCS